MTPLKFFFIALLFLLNGQQACSQCDSLTLALFRSIPENDTLWADSLEGTTVVMNFDIRNPRALDAEDSTMFASLPPEYTSDWNGYEDVTLRIPADRFLLSVGVVDRMCRDLTLVLNNVEIDGDPPQRRGTQVEPLAASQFGALSESARQQQKLADSCEACMKQLLDICRMCNKYSILTRDQVIALENEKRYHNNNARIVCRNRMILEVKKAIAQNSCN